MTVALAWVGKRPNGRDLLYIASDSRVTGGHTMDVSPKIFTLPRSDCALSFSGSTAAAYPLMMQIANAIAAHLPSRDRSLDITSLKGHVVTLCSDLINRYRGAPAPLDDREVQFLFAGFSWVTDDFEIWTIEYRKAKRAFTARAARSFDDRLRKAAFVGDGGVALRSSIVRELNRSTGPHWDLQPVRVLAQMLQRASPRGTIGGPPQVIRVDKSMNTRVYCVRWQGELTLFGRPLFDYESVDYRVLNPLTGAVAMPPPFGRSRGGTPELPDPS